VSAHAYPTPAVLADAGRAAAGLALAGIPLLLDGPAWLTVAFGLIALVFLLYAAASLCRATSRVEVGEDSIAVRGPRPARLRWSELDRLRLAYYSTRRDGAGGWMQLTLAAARTRLVVDSRIGGFDVLLRRAAEAARVQAIGLDPTTVMNLRDLGIVMAPTSRSHEAQR